jgi:peptidoglycan glycosyltransferase
MNRPIRKVAVALVVLLAALFVNLNFVQVVKGSDLRNDTRNRRVLLNEYASPRGDINVQGTAIAHSKATNDELKYLRVYPQGRLYAAVTGYYSFIYNASGIEAAEDSVLSGNSDKLFGSRVSDLLTGRTQRGGSVELTLDKAAQEAAYTNLVRDNNGRARAGAVVAIDPTTGAILAAVSSPSYDPSQLSSHNSQRIERAWKALNPSSPTSPLVNRAFNTRYPPGSTFKTIVAAAALKKGITPDSKQLAPNGYFPETGATGPCNGTNTACVQNFGGEKCFDGRFATFTYAFAKSCNTTFSYLAVEKLGGPAIAAEAKLFGFDPDAPLQIPLTVSPSTVGTRADLTEKGFLARTAFGQQDVAMTPLQGAMIASAVADNGRLMQPYLVNKEVAPNLSVLKQTQPTQLSQVLDPDVDTELQSMMDAVVTSPEGTGRSAQITDIPGVAVAGKTGTADTGRKLANGQDEPPHAWFIGYATRNGSAKIAVAVIIENGGVQGNETTGGEAAAPVAKAVMEAYLKAHPGG